MKEYILDYYEIHLPSGCEYAAVCWRIDREETQEVVGRRLMRTFKPVRKGVPFIDLVTIRGEEGDYWLDKNSPVAGGMYLDHARKIAKELALACDYLEEILATQEKIRLVGE